MIKRLRRLPRFLPHIAMLAAAALFSLGCGSQDQQSEGNGDKDGNEGSPEVALSGPKVKIGLACPITGSAAAFGDQIVKGAYLARDEINAAGGINGGELVLVIVDDQGLEDQASTVARSLVSDPELAAVVGHFNSICSAAGREVYKQKGILQLSPGSTNIDVCRLSEWTFRNLYHDGYQGQSVARYIKDALGHDSAAVFFDDDDYGRGLKNAFQEEAEKIGLDVVAEESYTRESTLDYAVAIDKVSALSPGIIFISGLYNEAAAIAKQAADKGVDIPIIGGDGLYSPDLIKSGEDAVEGLLLTTPFIVHPDIGGPAAQEFRLAFKEANGGQDPDAWAALTYDAVKMVADVIQKVGTDRTAIRDHMASIDTPAEAFRGVTGLTYFDENGDCPKLAYVAMVKNGEFGPAPKQLTSSEEETEADGGGMDCADEGGGMDGESDENP